MSLLEILDKQKAAAERFLLIAEGNKELRIWSHDLKQMAREQIRLIEAIKYLKDHFSLIPSEMKDLERRIQGVEVRRD